MRWLSLLLLAALCACAPVHTTRSLFATRPPPAPGALSVAIASDLRWPVRLARSAVSIDDVGVEPNRPYALAAGTHWINIDAELRWPCDVYGTEAIAVIHDRRSIELGPNGAEMQYAVLAQGTAFDIPERRFAFRRRLVGDARTLPAAPHAYAVTMSRYCAGNAD